MYPFLRLWKEVLIHRNAPPLGLGEVHVSRHVCWPWDLDPWRELNNGRTLTLYDLGRIPTAIRGGLIPVLRKNRWGLTVAGSCVRYRRRVQMFDRIEMRSRMVCWDERFLYIEQSMWKTTGECASHAAFRAAVTGPGGIVPPREVTEPAGLGAVSPEMPEWLAAWGAAEALRPWPPMQG